MEELPNLPGIRRDFASSMDRLKKRTKNSTVKELGLSDSIPSLDSADLAALSPFPEPDAEEYGDLEGRYSIHAQRMDRTASIHNLPYQRGSTLPRFIEFRDQVLRFWTYFEDIVPGNTRDSIIFRRCELNLFLEDCAIEVVETGGENAGGAHGTIVRRQHIHRVHPRGRIVPGDHYGIEDMSIGNTLEIFGRTFHIFDCDEFTRDFMEGRYGKDMAPAEMPEDEDGNSMNALGKTGEPSFRSMMKAHQKADFASFLSCDKQVLRFFCVFDDRMSLFGDANQYVLHYFLVDDTIEIEGGQTTLRARGQPPKLLKRSRVPKPLDADELASCRLDGPAVQIKFFHWMDLHIGALIPVFGHILRVDRADPFTSAFYEREGMPLGEFIVEDEPDYPVVTRIIPPHNGFGSAEDSLQSCDGTLQPKPIRKDGLKAKEKGGQAMRFKAKLRSDRKEDANREFMALYHLDDDTFSIIEEVIKNSGFVGGKFLSRIKVDVPGQGRYLNQTDLWVGAQIPVFQHLFEITQADEYTLRHMESFPVQFPHSDLVRICDVLRVRGSVVTSTIARQAVQARRMSFEGMRDLMESCGIQLNEQEWTTLNRGLDRKKKGSVLTIHVVRMMTDEAWVRDTLRR